MLKKLDIESRFVNGLRYTDKETAEVVQMVLAGKTNKDLVGLIGQLGGKAVGLCGIDGCMIQAKKLEGDYGYVGDITKIDTTPIVNAINSGLHPRSLPPLAPTAKAIFTTSTPIQQQLRSPAHSTQKTSSL